MVRTDERSSSRRLRSGDDIAALVPDLTRTNDDHMGRTEISIEKAAHLRRSQNLLRERNIVGDASGTDIGKKANIMNVYQCEVELNDCRSADDTNSPII